MRIARHERRPPPRAASRAPGGRPRGRTRRGRGTSGDTSKRNRPAFVIAWTRAVWCVGQDEGEEPVVGSRRSGTPPAATARPRRDVPDAGIDHGQEDRPRREGRDGRRPARRRRPPRRGAARSWTTSTSVAVRAGGQHGALHGPDVVVLGTEVGEERDDRGMGRIVAETRGLVGRCTGRSDHERPGVYEFDAGMERIYLDHNATTPLDPRVLEAMLPALRDQLRQPLEPPLVRPAGARGPGRGARGGGRA